MDDRNSHLDTYLIKLDGSGQTTIRNRQFLRKYKSFDDIEEVQEDVQEDVQENAHPSVVEEKIYTDGSGGKKSLDVNHDHMFKPLNDNHQPLVSSESRRWSRPIDTAPDTEVVETKVKNSQKQPFYKTRYGRNVYEPIRYPAQE